MTLSNPILLQIHLKGLAIAPGIAMGKLFLLPTAEEAITEKNLTSADIALEIEDIASLSIKLRMNLLGYSNSLKMKG